MILRAGNKKENCGEVLYARPDGGRTMRMYRFYFHDTIKTVTSSWPAWPSSSHNAL